jgi:flagellar motor switch/type III secretory pathway protein FliN
VSVQPFPFATLDALSRTEVTASARVRRAVKTHVDLAALGTALSEIAKERVDVIVRRYRRADGSKSAADAVGLVIEANERRILVEVEAALAAALAARVLQRPPPRHLDPTHPAPAALSGAVAALALAALRRAHTGAAFRMLEAGPAMAVAREHLARYPRATTAWLTVVIGADAYDARVTVDESVPPRVVASPLDLASLGSLPLALPIVAATCAASRSEIAALAPGDAFIVPGLANPPKTAALVPERGELGLAVEVAEPTRLVVRGRAEPFPWEVPMNADTTARVLDDASVVVRVEIGTVEMKAHEWAQLSTGDVVTLGKKLGEPVVLRAGGVEIARGELVQVEGEIGVRILSRSEDR